MTLRIYLTGALAVEHDALLVREDRFPGLQGRIVFALLAGERSRVVGREEIAEELWLGEPPDSWETALRAVVSKVRQTLSEANLPASSLAGAFGSYQLHLPEGAWVDLEAAADAIHRAETAARDGDDARAIGEGRVAAAITARPLLPGAAGLWVERRRVQLRDMRLRSLACLASTWLGLGEAETAARDAELAVQLDPFHEPSHRLLMRALDAAGNRAGALMAYESLRRTLADELGADPAPDTQEVYLSILRSA